MRTVVGLALLELLVESLAEGQVARVVLGALQKLLHLIRAGVILSRTKHEPKIGMESVEGCACNVVAKHKGTRAWCSK